MRREVLVCVDLAPPQRIKTLAHEWAHVTMHDPGDVSGVRRHVAEVEAESVAYLLCAAVGIDAAAYTVPYVARWSQGDVEIVTSTAERVLAATATLVARLEQHVGLTLTSDPLHQLRPEPEPRSRRPVVSFPLPDPDPIVADQPALQPLVDRTASSLLPA